MDLVKINTSVAMIKICKRCNENFTYGDITKSLRGQMTRKYCDGCIVLQHREESKIYQRRLFVRKYG